MKIAITYCTRYNGVNMMINDGYVEDERSDACMETIANHLADECSNDGNFWGDESAAVDFIVATAQKYYGYAAQVEVDFDHVSS
jgi:hypothetical protein